MGSATDGTRQLKRSVAKIQARIMALCFGTILGLGLFLCTAWLVVKGGQNVGEHLQLLGQYFIGYSVSWPGAFVGLFYGAVTGGVMGWLVGMIYNLVAGARFELD